MAGPDREPEHPHYHSHLLVHRRPARECEHRMLLRCSREKQPRTGRWPYPIYAAARLRWMKAERPESFARARALLGGFGALQPDEVLADPNDAVDLSSDERAELPPELADIYDSEDTVGQDDAARYDGDADFSDVF